MQQNIGQVMAAGVQAKDLTINHVRDRGQGVPILRVDVGERPDHSVPGQPGTNDCIFENIGTIVVVHEIKPRCLAKHSEDDCSKADVDQYQLIPAKGRRRTTSNHPFFLSLGA